MKREILILFPFALFIFFFYFSLGLVLQSLGYYHAEAVFLIEKSLLALRGNPPRLENIGLIYPPLPFFAIFPFVLINHLVSPLLASSLGMSFLFVFVGYRIIKKEAPRGFLFLMLAIFVLNPIFIYAGSSGGSLYLYLVFLSVFFIFIFEYHRTPISYYLSMAGLSLGILVFIRYEIMFILSVWFFANFALAVEATLERKVGYGEFFNLLKRLPAYRKTFFRRMFALYLMIFVPPIIGFLSWIYLNWIFTGNPFNFVDNPHAYFRTLRTYSLFNPILVELKGNILKSAFAVFKEILIYAPMFYLVVFIYRKDVFYLLALFSPVVALVISAYFGLTLLNVDFFVPIVMLSFIALIYKQSSRRMFYAYVFAFLLVASSIGGFYKLSISKYPEESSFFKAFTTGKVDGMFEDEKRVARFLSSVLSKTDIVLLDDGAGYPIIVFYGNPKNFVLPYQYEFSSVVSSPEIYADYVIVYDPRKIEGKSDAINLRHVSLYYGGREGLALVYSYKGWRVFKSTYR